MCLYNLYKKMMIMNIGEDRAMISNILVLILIVGTNAITWSISLPTKPEEHANKSGCYIREVDDVIPYTESIDALGYCYLIHCSVKQIDYLSCGVTSQVNEKCVVTEAKLDQPYPRCCPLVRCFDDVIPWKDEMSKQNSTIIPNEG